MGEKMSSAQVWTSEGGRRWCLPVAEPAVTAALETDLGLPRALAEVLAGRGFDLDAARSFLAPTTGFATEPAGALHDPFALHGMDRAVARIERALAEGEHIRLVTDYDVDGTTSCLILHGVLDWRMQESGSRATVSYHLPDRFVEGYGLSLRAVELAAEQGVTLLVTADIGVRDHVSVARARTLGMDVIVVDHHLPPGSDVPPDAHVVLCPPQAACSYPNKALAACGESFKLATALLAQDPRREGILRSLSKLVAIGTIADVVDLATPENRALVRLGLEALNAGGHAPGLAALLAVSGALGPDGAKEPITAGTVGWRIGPRINAAGRLEDATAVVKLLRERNLTRAREQAEALDALNRERQSIQDHLFQAALAQLPDPLPSFVVVDGAESEGWHRGVVGIVASKVRERVNRPVAVVARLGEGQATGSVRSVPGVHAVRALDACADLFVRYGGHAAAAGFSLPAERLPALKERLAAWVDAHHDAADLAGEERVDVTLPGSAVTLPLVRSFGLLEPCGKGNEQVRVAVTGRVEGFRVVNEKHLFFRVGGLDAVWWGSAERQARATAAQVVIGRLEVDRYGGKEKARVVVEDVV